ncbi:MAG: Cas10/Cmr2 second palm domain-containing protein [Ktedonobacteraceae bacterium]
MGQQSLITLDTDHIHGYVFETNRLQEIRGASSILDTLNRRAMFEIAEQEYGGQKVFANGGAGLFLIEGDATRAEEYGQRIQREYRKQTNGGVSITYAVQELPEGMDAWHEDSRIEREMLNYKLMQKKSAAPAVISLPSHPFLRPCSACGTRNAEYRDYSEANDEVNDLASQRDRYCSVCWSKRHEDDAIKRSIVTIVNEYRSTGTVDFEHNVTHGYAWARMIGGLNREEYDIRVETERPPDFNELRGITGGKDYLALVYADGNSMGQVFAGLKTLEDVRDTAKNIDTAVYKAMSEAVRRHLQVVPAEGKTPPRFPFDMLMMGGDDAIIVTPSPQALDVACTLAKTFHEETQKFSLDGKGFTLSIGVVFAPVNYPFALLYALAHDALKHAKKEGDSRKHLASDYEKTYINFMSVTGSGSLSFKKVYKSLYNKHVQDGEREVAMYATLRPYTVEELEMLLEAIRKGRGKGLGRTKLHQVRDAVLKMNLTTSVYEGMAVLSNWQAKQRDFVMEHVNILGKRYQEPYYDEEKPSTLFQRVTFPWFGDGPKTYRTSLLDFVELYNFIEQGEEEEVRDNAN